MPYDVNNDVRIYYETEGNGPHLLFTHSLTSSHQMWREYGYVDQLKDDFTTIIYDLRGHGQSAKPHEPQARLIVWGNWADDYIQSRAPCRAWSRHQLCLLGHL